MATIGQPLTAPESGWKRYNDTTGAVNYIGSWSIGKAPSSASTGSYQQDIHYTTDSNSYAEFIFTGTRLRLIAQYHTNRTESTDITIDGTKYTYTEYGAAIVDQAIVFEILSLSEGRHTVRIQRTSGYTGVICIDAIDIDSTGRLLHPDEVTNIDDLEVGKRIRCHYQASSGQVGVFSGLGEETSDFIPIAGAATPNGDLYLIMVEVWNGRKRLVSDRNVQHSISWDTLNSAGIASGALLDFMITEVPIMKSPSNGSITISQSAFKSPYAAWKVFDNVVSYWSTADNAAPTGGHWLQVDFGTQKKIEILKITSQIITNGVYAFKDFSIKASNDEVAWDTLYSGTHPNHGSEVAYNIPHSNTYRYYRIYGLNNHQGTNDNIALSRVKLASKVYKDYSFVATLLTGGVTAADKDNEWDKYIVNSTLNGAIIAGDSNVWNPLLATWTSTTSNVATYRTIRGGGSISGWHNGAGGSHYVGTNVGFRPVLEIEDLTQYRSFVKIDGEYKKLNSTWQTISTILPSVDTFIDEGMSDLSILNRKQTLITIPMDDNTPQGQPLGNGKMFKEKINLKKYMEINSINVK